MKSVEFELPMIAALFLLILIVVYFFKKRLKLPENSMFNVILISSFIMAVLDTLIHLLCSLNSFEDINTKFYDLINYANKVFGLLFVIIFTSFVTYLLMISHKKIVEKFDLIKKGLIGTYVVYAIISLFTNIELVEVSNVTNVKGPTIVIVYVIVGICLLASMIISLMNIGSRDKRYFPAFFIVLALLLAMLLTIAIPQLILYDVVLAVFCYVMYFTLQNPDLKMLESMEIAKLEAEKANRAKSDFLSSMSHEIRTPLNAIVGLSEDIGTFKDQIPTQVKEDSEDIISASETLLEIVGNILDISKIESDKMELIEVPYSFKDEAQILAKINSVRIGEKPINFKYHVAEDIPYELLGDKAHVKQIINNLLSNAIKYTNEGEINFNVNCINKNGICDLLITIQDTGIGIKPEKIDKLFNKFERLDVEKSATIEGTGLGLAITKKLVDKMGGRINVQSTYGKGSIFLVTIPQKISKMVNLVDKVEPAAPPVNQNMIVPTTPSAQSDGTVDIVAEQPQIDGILNVGEFGIKKILIVDDNKLNIKVAKRALTDFNFNIDEAEDGEQAIKKVREGNYYDLILMDIMMPNMNGETALRELRKDPNFKVPVIALTADAVSGAQEHYRSVGFNDYIAKPFTRDQIKEKLDQIFKN